MFEKAANVDEFNVAYAAERLAARRATVRILVVLADGMTRGSVEILAETVKPGGSPEALSTGVTKLPNEVTRMDSSRYQRMAEVPKKEFESYMLCEPEPSTAGTRRLRWSGMATGGEGGRHIALP